MRSPEESECVEIPLATETDNELNKEMEGYHNIVVVEPIAVVSQDLAHRLENIPCGFGSSDCILFRSQSGRCHGL